MRSDVGRVNRAQGRPTAMRAHMPFITFVCLAALVGTIASAHADKPNTVTELRKTCNTQDNVEQVACRRYIEGVTHGYFATLHTLMQHQARLPYFCVTPRFKNPKEIEDYVRGYLNSHPEPGTRDSEIVIFAAMREAYGCGD